MYLGITAWFNKTYKIEAFIPPLSIKPPTFWNIETKLTPIVYCVYIGFLPALFQLWAEEMNLHNIVVLLSLVY